MAPALTQDSQPELLLPYLTTPPYTPSPPSLLVASTSASTCATTSSTSPLRSSCTNMEVPPYGGHERQHSPAAASPLDTNTSNDAHVLNLDASHQEYKIGNFDDNISVDQRLVSVEPTPPHSTDSSAPLSPLPEKSHAPLSPLQRDKTSASPVSLDCTQSHLSPLSTSIHNRSLRLSQGFPEEEPMPCSFTFTRDDLGSVSTASQPSTQFGLLSPSSPDKIETSPSSSLVDAQQAPPERDSKGVSCTPVTTSATVAPNSRASATVTAAATAAVAGVAAVSDPPVVTATASIVDSTTCTTGAAISKALSIKPRTVSGVSSSSAVVPLQEVSPMGCSVPQVDNRVGSLCSAPQPNDTPPPPYTTLSLPSKTTASSGIFDDGILSTLPDDCFRTLDHLVLANPELLNELSYCPSSSVSNSSTIPLADGALSGSSASNCAGTTTSVLSNPSQLIAPNMGSNAVSGLSVSSEGANTNSLTSYAPVHHTGPVVVPTVTPVVLPMTPEVEASTILSSLAVRQLRLQKRQAQLLRRARRLTGRGLASSVSTQLSQLIKYGRPLLMDDVKTMSASDHKDSKSVNIANGSPVISSSFHQPPPRYDTAALKGMSTANLISYVRQMETRSSAVTNQKNSGVHDASTSHLTSLPPKTIEDPSTSVCFNENLRYELQTISGEVKASARLHVEHDSDATESSSGGESCDELDQDYNDEMHSDFKPISDRALYRYETTRAVIASRWVWLEALIADVECKVHQHVRAHLRLRHLNRYNTSALSDHPLASRTSTNPVLANRTAYTCGTRANINGINSGISINGTAATHVKNASGGASDLSKPGPVNCGDNDVPRKSNNSSDGNVPRLNTSNTKHCVSDANNDAGGPRVCTSDTGSPRLNTKDTASQRGSSNDVSGPRTSSFAAISSAPESNNDDGCARTKGLRWHRKRRWIRVGNIFEHGRGRAKDEPTQSDGANHLVVQPTLGVSCRCVAPSQCVMCTTLKARCNLPRSGALYSSSCNNTRSSSGCNNISNNMSHVNGMQTPLKKALSSASLSPSPTHLLRPSLSPLQVTPPRGSGPYLSSLLSPSVNLCSQISRIPSDAAGLHTSSTGLRGTDASALRSGSTSLRSVDPSADDAVSPGTTLLCKNAWYPRVAASSRVSLCTAKPQLLHERLASRDLGHHPLLSRSTEIPVSIRTESVLKSSLWSGKVASLVATSNESVAETSDSTSLSGAQASSLPGYCGLSSSSSRRHRSNNHHSNNNRRHRRHGDDAVLDDELYTPHKSSAKKKKKSKDKMKQRSKDRDEKRKEKKKKAFKRKEKLEQKGRLTLRLRKSSVTGELVATPSSLPDSAQLYHHDHQASGESGRGRGRHSLSFIPDDVSSLQSSSRASSPSLPPHSPVESRSVLQIRGNSFSSDARPLSRNNATLPHSPDTNQGSVCSPSPVTPRTPVTNSFVTGGRARNNASKPTHMLDRCVSSSAECGAAPGIAARRATVHSSLSTALAASTITGPLSAPVMFPVSPAATAATSSATSGPTVTPAAAAAVALRIKQGAASYDIDNIVIPYNMASVTRVEHIEYKEIVTPMWREIDELLPLLLDQTSCPVLEEDVCDTTVIARHEKSEELERLRFAAHLTTGGTRHGGIGRVRQRSTMVSATTATGSIAGTSSTGTNTPDNPLSPHVDVSDLATPPATPMALSEDSNHSSMSAQHAGITTESVGTSAEGGKDIIADARSCDGNQYMGDEAVPSSITDEAQGSYRANKSFHDDGAPKTDSPGEEFSSTASITSVVETAGSPTAVSIASIHSVTENSDGLISGVTINSPPAVSTNVAAPVCASTAPSVSTSGVPAVSIGSVPGVSQNNTVMVSGPRKPRNSTQTTTRLRTNSNNSSVNFNDDEGSTREVSPYPIRKFPLSDSQFASMVQENSEVIPYAAIAAANHSLLRSLDYDDLGEPSSDEHELEPDHVYDTSETMLAGKKRKHFESGVPSPVTEAEPKKRKKISPSIIVQDASDDSGLGIAPSLSNLPVQPPGMKSSRRVEESQLRLGRNPFSGVKKPSALVTFKEHLKKSNEGECGSEGRSSPLSEVTDSAAEDEMTGDLSDSSKPPDWTISATADSAGHCVMQVMRH